MASFKRDASGNWKKSSGSGSKNYTIVDGKKVLKSSIESNKQAADSTLSNSWGKSTVTLEEAKQQSTQAASYLAESQKAAEVSAGAEVLDTVQTVDTGLANSWAQDTVTLEQAKAQTSQAQEYLAARDETANIMAQKEEVTVVAAAPAERESTIEGGTGFKSQFQSFYGPGAAAQSTINKMNDEVAADGQESQGSQSKIKSKLSSLLGTGYSAGKGESVDSDLKFDAKNYKSYGLYKKAEEVTGDINLAAGTVIDKVYDNAIIGKTMDVVLPGSLGAQTAKSFAKGTVEGASSVIPLAAGIPLAGEIAIKEPEKVGAAVALGTGLIIGSTVKVAKEDPAKLAGNIAGGVLLGKAGGKLVPKSTRAGVVESTEVRLTPKVTETSIPTEVSAPKNVMGLDVRTPSVDAGSLRFIEQTTKKVSSVPETPKNVMGFDLTAPKADVASLRFIERTAGKSAKKAPTQFEQLQKMVNEPNKKVNKGDTWGDIKSAKDAARYEKALGEYVEQAGTGNKAGQVPINKMDFDVITRDVVTEAKPAKAPKYKRQSTPQELLEFGKQVQEDLLNPEGVKKGRKITQGDLDKLTVEPPRSQPKAPSKSTPQTKVGDLFKTTETERAFARDVAEGKKYTKGKRTAAEQAAMDAKVEAYAREHNLIPDSIKDLLKSDKAEVELGKFFKDDKPLTLEQRKLMEPDFLGRLSKGKKTPTLEERRLMDMDSPSPEMQLERVSTGAKAKPKGRTKLEFEEPKKTNAFQTELDRLMNATVEKAGKSKGKGKNLERGKSLDQQMRELSGESKLGRGKKSGRSGKTGRGTGKPENIFKDVGGSFPSAAVVGGVVGAIGPRKTTKTKAGEVPSGVPFPSAGKLPGSSKRPGKKERALPDPYTMPIPSVSPSPSKGRTPTTTTTPEESILDDVVIGGATGAWRMKGYKAKVKGAGRGGYSLPFDDLGRSSPKPGTKRNVYRNPLEIKFKM